MKLVCVVSRPECKSMSFHRKQQASKRKMLNCIISGLNHAYIPLICWRRNASGVTDQGLDTELYKMWNNYRIQSTNVSKNSISNGTAQDSQQCSASPARQQLLRDLASLCWIIHYLTSLIRLYMISLNSRSTSSDITVLFHNQLKQFSLTAVSAKLVLTCMSVGTDKVDYLENSPHKDEKRNIFFM